MRIIEGIGIGVFVLLCALGVLFIRREIIGRGRGTIEVNLRLSTRLPGRGWSPGIARFVGDELRWYRMFSFAPRPRRTLYRLNLSVQTRAPDGPERLVLPADWTVVRCSSQQAPVSLTAPMASSGLSGAPSLRTTSAWRGRSRASATA